MQVIEDVFLPKNGKIIAYGGSITNYIVRRLKRKLLRTCLDRAVADSIRYKQLNVHGLFFKAKKLAKIFQSGPCVSLITQWDKFARVMEQKVRITIEYVVRSTFLWFRIDRRRCILIVKTILSSDHMFACCSYALQRLFALFM